MLKGLFGPTTASYMLRGGLEETSATHRVIAGRVATLISSSSNVDFANQLAQKTAQGRLDDEELQQDMAALADTQLRYEADAKLLQQAYGQLRSAMRGQA